MLQVSRRAGRATAAEARRRRRSAAEPAGEAQRAGCRRCLYYVRSGSERAERSARRAAVPLAGECRRVAGGPKGIPLAEHRDSVARFALLAIHPSTEGAARVSASCSESPSRARRARAPSHQSRPVAVWRSDGPTLHGADHNDVADARRDPLPTVTSPEEPRLWASAASPVLRSDRAAIERRTPPAGPPTGRAGTLAERRRSGRRLARRPTIISPHCGEATEIAPRCVRKRGRVAAPRSGEPSAAPVPASGKDRSLASPGLRSRGVPQRTAQLRSLLRTVNGGRSRPVAVSPGRAMRAGAARSGLAERRCPRSSDPASAGDRRRGTRTRRSAGLRATRRLPHRAEASNLVDPASSHMLVSKTKPCMSQCKPN